MSSIKIWDRKSQSYFNEKVLGEKWIRLGYENPVGKVLTKSRFFQSTVSKMVGAFQNTPLSKSQISPFINEYKVDMSLFETPHHGFDSFNDFFIRKVKNPEKFFPAEDNPLILRSPVEARVSVFEFHTKDFRSQMVVKGQKLSLTDLCPTELLNSLFGNDSTQVGHVWVFRLCPVDYHRFHFFDSGAASKPLMLGRDLHSVNPASLSVLPRVFLENERQISVFSSDHFGKVLYLEIGALCVGKIIQTFNDRDKVLKGQEKGFFEFGGSTVVLITQNKHVNPHPDLINKTLEGFESKVFLGDPIGEATNP